MFLFNYFNQDIDGLVSTCWENYKGSIQETLLVPLRSESESHILINETFYNEEKSSDLIIEKDNTIFSSLNENNGIIEYLSSKKPHLIAIDGGVATLGKFQNGGTAFAVRGAAVCYTDSEIFVLRYNTGPLIINSSNKIRILHYLGKTLGDEGFYLKRDELGEYNIPKASTFETDNQIQDRCRSFVERMIQKEALEILVKNKRGLLLLDGALSAGTFDSPAKYLTGFLSKAVSNCVDVAALSKKTTLTYQNISISDIFDNKPEFVGYLPLKEVIENERENQIEQGESVRSEITLGNELYAVKFGMGPPGIAFRVDVKNSLISTSEEVIKNLFRSCQIVSCYPKPLIEAHQWSSFFYQDIQSMTAEVIAKTGAIMKEEQSMDWMFQPFGAFGK